MKIELTAAEILSTDPAHTFTEIADNVYQREDGVLLVIAADGKNAILIDRRP